MELLQYQKIQLPHHLEWVVTHLLLEQHCLKMVSNIIHHHTSGLLCCNWIILKLYGMPMKHQRLEMAGQTFKVSQFQMAKIKMKILWYLGIQLPHFLVQVAIHQLLEKLCLKKVSTTLFLIPMGSLFSWRKSLWYGMAMTWKKLGCWIRHPRSINSQCESSGGRTSRWWTRYVYQFIRKKKNCCYT